jgi:hypothetical protein
LGNGNRRNAVVAAFAVVSSKNTMKRWPLVNGPLINVPFGRNKTGWAQGPARMA